MFTIIIGTSLTEFRPLKRDSVPPCTDCCVTKGWEATLWQRSKTPSPRTPDNTKSRQITADHAYFSRISSPAIIAGSGTAIRIKDGVVSPFSSFRSPPTSRSIKVHQGRCNRITPPLFPLASLAPLARALFPPLNGYRAKVAQVHRSESHPIAPNRSESHSIKVVRYSFPAPREPAGNRA